jgi:ABC-type transporter lipoprotein component MlaA
MTIGRTIRIFAATFIGAALISASASALFSPRIEDFEDTVRAELEQYGIGESDVLELNVYPHYNRRDQVDRATGWVQVAQCPDAWIVVNMSAFATVTQAYTRGQCNIPGLN